MSIPFYPWRGAHSHCSMWSSLTLPLEGCTSALFNMIFSHTTPEGLHIHNFQYEPSLQNLSEKYHSTCLQRLQGLLNCFPLAFLPTCCFFVSPSFSYSLVKCFLCDGYLQTLKAGDMRSSLFVKWSEGLIWLRSSHYISIAMRYYQ